MYLKWTARRPVRSRAIRPWLLVAILASCVWGAPPMMARQAPRPPSETTSVTIAELPRSLHAPLSDRADIADLHSWADAWFKKELAAPGTGAPGAVVSVVSAERVLLARGYGVADLTTRRPVASDTVFRVGSVSKPITATAVMQLAEAGLLDVHAPVGRYLHAFTLPVEFGRPVTVLDLVTHTGGFDVRLEGTAAASDAGVQRLGPYLRAHMPPQVRRSGDVLAYSNHGYALLGLLVEEVSGRTFEDYVRDRIFAPLGMPRSSFRFPPGVQSMAATGYEPDRSGFRRSAIVHPHIYPAAGLATTADDMARFMMAQLSGGRQAGTVILSAASVAEMHRQQFAQAPGVPGTAFGFFETTTRGEPALVHGGGIRGFMSGVCLWPRLGLGLFVSDNGYSPALVQRFLAAFVARYLADERAPAQIVRRRDASFDEFIGAYRAAGQTRGTLEKAGALWHGDLDVRTAGGYWPRLSVDGDPFEALGNASFVLSRGEDRLAFVRDAAGRVSKLVTDSPLTGCEVFERLPWYETSRFHRELLLLFGVLSLSVFVPPWTRRIEWGRREGRWATWYLRAVCGLDMAFFVLLVLAFRAARDTGLQLGLPPFVRFDLWLSQATAVLALGLPIAAVSAWRMGYWSRAGRLHYALCTAGALGFAVVLDYWHLLGR